MINHPGPEEFVVVEVTQSRLRGLLIDFDMATAALASDFPSGCEHVLESQVQSAVFDAASLWASIRLILKRDMEAVDSVDLIDVLLQIGTTGSRNKRWTEVRKVMRLIHVVGLRLPR